MNGRRLHRVILYGDGIPDIIDWKEITGYLGNKLGHISIEERGNPFAPRPDRVADYARRLASIKIVDARKKLDVLDEPLYGEVQYEKRRITGLTRSFGILYDGARLQRVFAELIAREEHRVEFIHIMLTSRLFATWEENDRRYHARTSIYAFPSVISTTGIVEAPAKPREYYLLKQQYDMLGRDLLELQEKFRGRFIDYDDERLTEVVKGYLMQAVFYHLTGNPFCQDPDCRLFNAHWQEELIRAQIESGELCERHEKALSAQLSAISNTN
ncbi:MAG: hypothetical protein HY667_02195 [Chloroflexi bacterium]|nr:hypothetical protein [Chloroflexota bacterium]